MDTAMLESVGEVIQVLQKSTRVLGLQGELTVRTELLKQHLALQGRDKRVFCKLQPNGWLSPLRPPPQV